MVDPVKVSRGGVYIPEWENADRDDKDKIKVHYRFLSFAEQQALIHYDDLGKTMAYDSRQLEAMVTKVDNLTVVDDDGKTKAIKNGSDLINEPGTEWLCLELWLHLRKLSTVDKKKLPSESSFGPKGSTTKASGEK